MAPRGPMTSVSLWGDEQFSDAVVVFGDQSWKVHRCVVCTCSDYFMKALEGKFKEAKNKTVVLTMDDRFTADDINDLLHFLYTNDLTSRQKSDPLATFMVADYFQAKALREDSVVALRSGLTLLVETAYWRNFRKYAFKLLGGELAGGDIEKMLVEVTAQHIGGILHESGVWDEIVDVYPAFASKVLKELVPKPQPTHGYNLRRRTSMAYDDLHKLAQVEGESEPGSSRDGPY